MSRPPFASIELAANRSRSKPRVQGRTSIDDPGLGVRALDDLLETASAYTDLARISLGIARLLDEGVLRARVDAYARHDVGVFTDGRLLEHAHAESGASACAEFLAESARLGFTLVEISDALAPRPLAARIAQVQAVRDAGLGAVARVAGEPSPQPGAALADEIAALAEAGCHAVSLAARAFCDEDGPRRATLAALAATPECSLVLFELPDPGGPAMARTLVSEFGVDVGLGSVAPAAVLGLESLRAGLGAERLSAGSRRVILAAET